MNKKRSTNVYLLVAVAAVIAFLPNRSISEQKTQPDQQAPSAAATLKENTDWLKEKLIKSVNQFELKDNRLLKVDRAQFDGCNLKYVEIQSWDMSGKGRVSAQREVSFSLKDIDPSKITVTTFREHPSVVFETKAGKADIEIRVLLPGNAPKKQFAMYMMPFRDSAIAQEVGKVFSQAVKLCQQEK